MKNSITKINPYLKSFTNGLNFGKDLFNSNYLSVVEKQLKSNNGEKSIDIRENEVVFRYKVQEGTLNYWGAMHGGSIATLIDIASTIAITACDRTNRKNVSIELSTNYVGPIKPDADVFVVCKVNKIGKTVAYSTIEVIDTNSLDILATGTHTKAMLDSIWELKENDKI